MIEIIWGFNSIGLTIVICRGVARTIACGLLAIVVRSTGSVVPAIFWLARRPGLVTAGNCGW